MRERIQERLHGVKFCVGTLLDYHWRGKENALGGVCSHSIYDPYNALLVVLLINVFILTPILPVIVHRLGDVSALRQSEGRAGVAEKRMSPTWLAFALAVLLRVIDGACMHVVIVSDGTSVQVNETIATVQSLLVDHAASSSSFSALQSSSVSSAAVTHETSSLLIRRPFIPTIHAAQLSVSEALHLMTNADVLVAGCSGFSRLAAMLSNHIRIVPALRSHPLMGDGVIVVPRVRVFWDWHNTSVTILQHALQHGAADGVEVLLRMALQKKAKEGIEPHCLKYK